MFKITKFSLSFDGIHNRGGSRGGVRSIVVVKQGEKIEKIAPDFVEHYKDRTIDVHVVKFVYVIPSVADGGEIVGNSLHLCAG